jgi:hypothetical protein
MPVFTHISRPPAQYNHPYSGQLIVLLRDDYTLIRETCSATRDAIASWSNALHNHARPRHPRQKNKGAYPRPRQSTRGRHTPARALTMMAPVARPPRLTAEKYPGTLLLPGLPTAVPKRFCRTVFKA